MPPPSYGTVVLALTVVTLVVVIITPFRSTSEQQWVKRTFSDDTLRPPEPKTRPAVPKNGCRPSKKPNSHSQAWEDFALFAHYFSSPLVCNGTFVELGALDGVSLTNTKFYEDHLGWNGVLIEANPDNAKKLMTNRPNTKNFALAICPEGTQTITFRGKDAIGGIEMFLSEQHKKRWIKPDDKPIEVPCKPMSAVLKEANIRKIDFFSLDVEGAELVVLQTMDWTIPVRIFMIEMGHGDDDVIIKFLADRGYVKADWNIREHCSKANNVVFENTKWPFSSDEM